MTAAVGQNFTVYQGDSSSPVITVTDGATPPAPIDISSAVEIAWIAYRSGVAVLTKLKSTGGIVFVNTGADGKFKLILTPADTIALVGNYPYLAKITDNTGAVTTVTSGSVQIGPAPQWTFDATALIGTSAYNMLMQVRTLIADTNSKDSLLWDEQIGFAITQRPNIYAAAADCCRQIAAKYSRDVDTTEGLLHKNYSARQRAFAARAAELDQRAKLTGKGVPYAGGISQSDKNAQNQDSDRVIPQFMVGLTDNWLPLPPVDNEISSQSNGGAR